MPYIVAEYIGKEVWYIENHYRGYSLYMTQDKSEAQRFRLIEAIRIADNHGMLVESPNRILTSLYRKLRRQV